MGREKLSLNLVGNEKLRRLTFERRKKGVIKKAEEFSILCGVDTCVIIYGTQVISDQPDVPEIWPPNPEEVARIIQRYKNEGVNCHKKRAVVGLAEFFQNRKKKLDTDLVKVRTAVWEANIPFSHNLIAKCSEVQLLSLRTLLVRRLESAKKRLKAKEEKEATSFQARSSINIVAPGAGFDSDRRHFHHQQLRHSFYVQASAGPCCHEPNRINVNLPPFPSQHHAPSAPVPLLPISPPAVDLSHFGPAGLSSVLRQRQTDHHPVSSLDGSAPSSSCSKSNCATDHVHMPAAMAAHHFLAGNRFHHHPHRSLMNCTDRTHNCSSPAVHHQYSAVLGFPVAMHEPEP
ncbi:hypothetical protein CDL15_Pgr020380 [Punica granatum]|uniref:MADS-box domain-containing protein n=1 Tax=Punica granatum TaxID=22663 RepID=A0A218VVR8_PUNGR|nr:hypothetical protein CDL15_Pgr020380 [Punica granatum]